MANILPSTRAKKFSLSIKFLMAAEGWTQQDLADWLQISRPTMRKYLQDSNLIPGGLMFQLMSRMESNGINWQP